MAEHHQTFKHHRIVVTQETYGEDWYIRVTAPNGCYAYDGWWRNSAGKTAMQALEEAKHGAGLADGVDSVDEAKKDEQLRSAVRDCKDTLSSVRKQFGFDAPGVKEEGK